MSFWQKLLERFSSTKFLAALAGVVTSTVAFAKGEITAEIWVGSVTILIAAWGMAQGRVDAAKNGFNKGPSGNPGN